MGFLLLLTILLPGCASISERFASDRGIASGNTDAMPDSDQWQEQLNVVRKPDWPLDANEAIKYKLVTELI